MSKKRTRALAEVPAAALTAAEAGAALSLGEDLTRRAVAGGLLPGVKVGGRLLVSSEYVFWLLEAAELLLLQGEDLLDHVEEIRELRRRELRRRAERRGLADAVELAPLMVDRRAS